MKNKNRVVFIAQTGMIAAIYVALTYLSNMFNLSYGSIQFRLSEILTVLPVLTPAAVPGLAIGCFFGNIGSPYPADMIFGTLATLLAAIGTRAVRNIKIKNIPLLAPLFPVIVNAVVVGTQISMFMSNGFTAVNVLVFGSQVALGEAVMCYVAGLPLTLALKKTKIFSE